MFYDRNEAAIRLITALQPYKHEDAVILAIPRGGVPIGKKVAMALNKPLDISLVKKIGHPYNKEYAIGAVGIENEYFSGAESAVPIKYIEDETKNVRQLLKERYRMYMGDKTPIDLKHKTVIIVDDGIATGSTLLATVQLAKNKGAAKVIVAVPVGPLSAVRKINEVADDVICLETPSNFNAVGQFYENFEQVDDHQVIDSLKQ